MDFQAFDQSKLEQYKNEAREKWGSTAAYREYSEKHPDAERSAEPFMALFAELGTLRELPPDAEPVQEKIAGLQRFITGHYYTCTDEILAGLGEMYVGDERFRENIDRAGGDGTAAFVREAIRVFCGK